jgi:hypothetical protein
VLAALREVEPQRAKFLLDLKGLDLWCAHVIGGVLQPVAQHSDEVDPACITFKALPKDAAMLCFQLLVPGFAFCVVFQSRCWPRR